MIERLTSSVTEYKSYKNTPVILEQVTTDASADYIELEKIRLKLQELMTTRRKLVRAELVISDVVKLLIDLTTNVDDEDAKLEKLLKYWIASLEYSTGILINIQFTRELKEVPSLLDTKKTPVRTARYSDGEIDNSELSRLLGIDDEVTKRLINMVIDNTSKYNDVQPISNINHVTLNHSDLCTVIIEGARLLYEGYGDGFEHGFSFFGGSYNKRWSELLSQMENVEYVSDLDTEARRILAMFTDTNCYSGHRKGAFL